MHSILITGGAGYIGSHISLSLLEKGFNIYSIDSFVNSNGKAIKILEKYSASNSNDSSKNFYFYNGDIRDEELLIKIFSDSRRNEYPIEAVIHFAGLKSVVDSTKYPLKYWSNNIFGTINLLNVMERFSCSNIIFSSSATVYGQINDSPISEDSIISPINPYGKTKAYIESLLYDLSESKGKSWNIRILRYFNPVGSHSSGLLGENSFGENDNLFPILCNVAVGNKTRLNIFGRDWPTKDGTCIRDYIHVMDLAEGHIKALNHLFTQKKQLIHLNIGTGLGHSVLDLIKTFETVNEVKVPFQITSRRDGDVCKLVANNSKAKEILNWNPIRSLHEMCKDGWKWKLMNPKGYIL